MTQRIITGRLGSAVTAAGTTTVSYPAALAPDSGNTDEGAYFGAMGHKLVLGQALLSFPGDFDITYGTDLVTITNKTSGTWAAETDYRLELQIQGKPVYLQDAVQNIKAMNRMARSDCFLINLGAPDALITNGVMAQQNITAAGSLIVNGTLASGGVVTLDVPRNVIAKSGGADTAVLTVTGVDEYGAVMKEALTLNGTTAVSGKKAFKKVTAITASAAVANTAFVGTGDVLGLPVFLPSSGHIVKDLENGTAATAGTYVAGFRTGGGHTSTGADVRGTYDPNSTCDGDKVFQLILSLPDPTFRGVTQYAG